MKKIIIIACIAIFSISIVSAQPKKQFYSIEYSTGVLLGQSHQFIPNYSWAGFQISGQFNILEHLAIGVKFGLNHHYGYKASETYPLGKGMTIYASTYRYLRHIPFGVGVFYNILPDKIVKPYIGFHIGGNYETQSIYIQDIQFHDDQYGFELSPEIGAFFQFGKAPCGLKLSAIYTWGTNQYVFGGTKFKNYQCFNVNLGFTYIVN
ncbi:MAG: hypothetical protein RR356_04975 [Bacteroidales bacterium]